MDKIPDTSKNKKLSSSDEASPDIKTDDAVDETAQTASQTVAPEATPKQKSPVVTAPVVTNPLEIAEIVNQVAQYLPEDSKKGFAATSRLFHNASQMHELAYRCALRIAQADEEKIKELFTLSPSYISYITSKTKFKDPAGRELDCSPFQYALWTRDWHMWMMMLTALDETEEKAIPQAEWDATSEAARRSKPYLGSITKETISAIRGELLNQYKEVIDEGLDYTITRYQRVLDDNGKYQLVEPRVVEVKGETHFDLRGPEFCLMPQTSDFTPEKGKLYVEIKNDFLHYRVIALSGETVRSRINLADLKCPLEQLNAIAPLKPYFHRILKITAEKDHTHPQALISAFETYICGLQNDLAREQIESLWCSGVGMAEREAPAVIAQEICRKDVLLSALTRDYFQEPDFPRTMKYYNVISYCNDPWFPPAGTENRLGLDFGIINKQFSPNQHKGARLVLGHDAQEAIRNLGGLSNLDNLRRIHVFALRFTLQSAAKKQELTAHQDPTSPRGPRMK